MKGYKRVPALEKGFGILKLLTKEKRPLGITEISEELNLNKSTVFNIVYTLAELGVLENSLPNKFRLGPQLFVLGNAAGQESGIIQVIHPFLEEINRKTRLSVFLGFLSGERIMIVDKVDSPLDIRVSSEIGMQIPLLAGASGKVFLSQMTDTQVEEVLSRNKLKSFTARSCTDITRYKEMLIQSRREGVAVDDEEYIEGLRALAVPVKVPNHGPVAIWVMGLKSQIRDEEIPYYSGLLKEAAQGINSQLS